MKILMVCLGNICRSPLAEGILRQQLNKLNINATVDSVGFEPYHVGDQPDWRAREVAQKHGIDISGHRARLFRKDDFDHFDWIYVMDSGNYQDVMSMAHSDADKKKVDYILNAADPGSNDEVPDPYYGGKAQFEAVYHLLEEACTKIAQRMQGN
jgi:protein-tyrosine phosphatase